MCPSRHYWVDLGKEVWYCNSYKLHTSPLRWMWRILKSQQLIAFVYHTSDRSVKMTEPMRGRLLGELRDPWSTDTGGPIHPPSCQRCMSCLMLLCLSCTALYRWNRLLCLGERPRRAESSPMCTRWHQTMTMNCKLSTAFSFGTENIFFCWRWRRLIKTLIFCIECGMLC